VRAELHDDLHDGTPNNGIATTAETLDATAAASTVEGETRMFDPIRDI
jgi:hypothetical protein